MLSLKAAPTLDPVIGRLLETLLTGQAFPVPGPHEVIEAAILIGKPLIEVPDR
jgi:hypothetical protein